MIILEGPDCGGKSTLGVRLAEQYDSPVIHFSSHDPDVMKKLAEEGEYGTAKIVDRLHLSEPPYSMYYRHETPDYESVDAIDNILASGNHLVILCIPPWNEVKKHWEERIDQELVKNLQALHGIYMWYVNRAGKYNTPSIHWDYTYMNLEGLFRDIDDFFSETVDG